jgi:hypothetical protein
MELIRVHCAGEQIKHVIAPMTQGLKMSLTRPRCGRNIWVQLGLKGGIIRWAQWVCIFVVLTSKKAKLRL